MEIGEKGVNEKCSDHRSKRKYLSFSPEKVNEVSALMKVSSKPEGKDTMEAQVL